MSAPKQPPHSLEAERSVIGQILAGGTKIAGEVIGTQLSPADFYAPANQIVFDAIYNAYFSDDPIDPLSIGEVASKQLARLWSCDENDAIVRVRDLALGQQFSGNVLDHGKVVKRHAHYRKILDLSASAVKEVGDEKRSPEEIASLVSHQAMRIATDSLLTHELLSFGDLGRNYLKYAQMLQQAREKGVELGAYFGFQFLDRYMRGLQPSELWILAGEPGAGKALALDTPLPTPTGWTIMEHVQVGDELLDEKGQPCLVTAVTEVLEGRPCYRLTFSDATSIVADGKHEWVTANRKDYMWAWRAGRSLRSHIRTTEEIAATLYRSDGGNNHSVQVAESLDLPECDLLVSPYTLGVWLGDGTRGTGKITCGEAELVPEIEKDGYAVSHAGGLNWRVHGLARQLTAIGVCGEKRIPLEYLRASQQQRLALLQGLVDSDGHVSSRGQLEITLMNEPLAQDVYELIVTLGMKATLTKDTARYEGRTVGERQRVRCLPDLPVARLARKAERLSKKAVRRGIHLRRFIVKAERIDSVPVRCVEVSSPSHLYLAGESMVPTHNSFLGWRAAMQFAERQMRQYPGSEVGTLVLSLEMGETPSNIRLAQTLAKVDGAKLREGTQTGEEFARIEQEWGKRQKLPMFFNFTSHMRASQIRALAVEAIRRHNVGLILIDHMRYFDMDEHYANKTDEDEAKARFLKESIAKDLNCAVVCIAHTTKAIEGSPDRRPQLSHLRGSGQVAAHADFVSFVYRPYKYAEDADKISGSVKETDAEMIWSKNRHGLDDTEPFYFRPETGEIR